MSPDEPALAPVLLDWDEDSFVEHWDAVEVFVLEHGAEVAALHAARWLRGRDVNRYALAVDVLVCVARRDRGYLPAATDAALAALDAGDDDLRWIGAHALATVPTLSAAPTLLTLLTDEDDVIRWQALTGLADLGAELPADHEIVRALVRAMDDDDHDVRRWAVFCVAQAIDADSAEIRAALVTHLEGHDEELAADACVGLAARGDARVDDVLATQLLHVGVAEEYLEAAAERRRPELLPLLEELREEERYRDGEEWSWAAELDRAISACSGDGVDTDR